MNCAIHFQSANLLERIYEILVLQIQNYIKKHKGTEVYSQYKIKTFFSEATASFQTAQKPSHSITESQSLTKLIAISMILQSLGEAPTGQPHGPITLCQTVPLKVKTMVLKWFVLKDRDPKHCGS